MLVPLIYHSNWGVQYAFHVYVNCQKEHSIQISMIRKEIHGNAFAESFFKTLKCEEVYFLKYKTFGGAYQNIEKFIEEVCNEKRLHLSIKVSAI